MTHSIQNQCLTNVFLFLSFQFQHHHFISSKFLRGNQIAHPEERAAQPPALRPQREERVRWSSHSENAKLIAFAREVKFRGQFVKIP